MVREIRKIIFKILFGRTDYDFLISILTYDADTFYKKYAEWKPLSEYDINIYGPFYTAVVKILKKLGVEYDNE